MGFSRQFRPGLLSLLAILALTGCNRNAPAKRESSADRPSAERVTLLLNWFPEAEHGGFYAAKVHGFFEKEGLDVNVLPGGPGASVVPRVASGDVDFGIENADNVLLGRAQEAPVVALMAPIQTSPRCIMVHEESGITDLRQLRNLTLAMNAGGAFSHYLKKHVPLEGVKIVPYPGNVARFVSDKKYAQQGYVFSEPYLAAREGAKPRALLLSDIGFNPYTSCLITNEDTFKNRRSVVERMVRASVRGWEQYLSDPALTHARISELNPEMDRNALEYGWRALRSLVMTEEARRVGVGVMTEKRWTELRDQLEEIGLIPPGKVNATDAFSVEFLSGPKSDGADKSQAH